MSKLSDCVNILDSKRVPLSSKVRANLTKKYPYYGAQGIVDYVDDYLFDGSYILVAEDGNNLKSLNEPITTWATGKFWVNNHAHILGEKDGYCLKYIYYLLTCMDLRGYITGSAQPKFNQDNLANVKLNLPELSTQIRISDVLTVLDGKISNNNALCTELESMAKTLYDYWFTQFDFPDENGKPYRSSGGEMVWNDQLKREIPKGWKTKRLSDICSFRNGINYEKGCAGNRIYKIANVRNITASSLLMDVSDFDEISLPSEQADRYAIKRNDIIIARSGTPGATRLILKPADNVIFCGFIICCTPEASNHRMFLAHFLKQLEGTNATQTGGSILQNVSQDTLKSLYVAVPNDEVIDSFNEKILPMIEMMQHAIDENSELTKLRDWLLPMLMNGQAVVSD